MSPDGGFHEITGPARPVQQGGPGALPFIVARISGRSHAGGWLTSAGGLKQTSTTGREPRPPVKTRMN